ncbi:ATP-binding protein ['Paenibacillus yunnanensis' Narsing Rao et al. 2020]|uniref:ATP-binding protein n=1 Tax=Paenibacillus tengchongensis TaxID=2608684 RepID=UPI00124DE9DE|nr:ATP-binding protein [Paenibacillus tengchongensis]
MKEIEQDQVIRLYNIIRLFCLFGQSTYLRPKIARMHVKPWILSLLDILLLSGNESLPENKLAKQAGLSAGLAALLQVRHEMEYKRYDRMEQLLRIDHSYNTASEWIFMHVIALYRLNRQEEAIQLLNHAPLLDGEVGVLSVKLQNKPDGHLIQELEERIRGDFQASLPSPKLLKAKKGLGRPIHAGGEFETLKKHKLHMIGIGILSRILEAHAPTSELWERLAYFYTMIGKVDFSFECYYEAALQRNRHNSWLELFKFCESNHMWFEACLALLQALYLRPTEKRTVNNMKYILDELQYREMQDEKESSITVSYDILREISELAKLVQMKSEFSAFYRLMGVVNTYKGEYDTASKLYRSEIKSEDELPIAYLAKIGIWQMKRGFLQDAGITFEEILKQDNENPFAQTALRIVENNSEIGWIHPELLKVISKYQKPSFDELNLLEDMLIREKGLDATLSQMDLLRELFPEDVPILIRCSRLYEMKQQPEEAFYLINESLNKLVSDTMMVKSCLFCFQYGYSNKAKYIWDHFNSELQRQDPISHKRVQRLYEDITQLYMQLEPSEEEHFRKLCSSLRADEAEALQQPDFYSFIAKALSETDEAEMAHRNFRALLLKHLLVQFGKCNWSFFELNEASTGAVFPELSGLLKRVRQGLKDGQLSEADITEAAAMLLKNDLRMNKVLMDDALNSRRPLYLSMVIDLFILVSEGLRGWIAAEIYNKVISWDLPDEQITEWFNQLIEIDKEPRQIKHLAFHYYRHCQWDRAYELYDRLLQQFPNNESGKVRKYRNACFLLAPSMAKLPIEEHLTDCEFLHAVNYIMSSEITKENAHDISLFPGRLLKENYKAILLGLEAQYANRFEEALNHYQVLKTSCRDAYQECISRLLRAVKYNEPDHNLRFHLEFELLELVGVPEQQEEHGAADEELEDIISDKTDSGLIIAHLEDQPPLAREYPEGTQLKKSLPLATPDLQEMAPALWRDYEDFDFSVFTSDHMTTDEMVRSLERTNNPGQRRTLYFRLARYHQDSGNTLETAKYIGYAGKESAILSRKGRDMDRLRVYAFESLSLLYRIGKKGQLLLIKEILWSMSQIGDVQQITTAAPIVGSLHEYSEGVNRHVRYVLKKLSDVSERVQQYVYSESPVDRVQYYHFIVGELNEARSYTKKNVTEMDFKDVLSRLLVNWHNIFQEESKRVMETPQIIVKLQHNVIRKQDAVFIDITNNGNSPAQKVTITMDLRGAGKVKGSNDYREIGTIHSKGICPLRFDCEMWQDGETMIDVTVTYSDLRRASEIQTHTFVLKVHDEQDEFKIITNPYVTIVVSGAEHFYGRLNILDSIYQKINGSVFDVPIVLHGLRRVGKTSILNHLLEKFPEKNKNFLPVLVDSQGENRHRSTDNPTAFLVYEAIVRTIHRAMRRRKLMLPLPPFERFSKHPLNELNYFFDEIEDEFPELMIILMFDEFEGIIAGVETGEYDPFLLDYIRNQIQHRRGLLRFIFTGADHIREKLRTYSSQMFHLLKEVEVSFMEEDETKEMIVNPLLNQVTYLEHSVDHIYQLTNGHPYYTKVICHALIEKLNDEERTYVHLADVLQEVEVLEKRGDYTYIWDMVFHLEKIILSILANDTSHIKELIPLHVLLGKLEEYVKFNVVTVQNSLLRLIDLNVIVEKTSASGDKAYRITADLYRKWFRYHKPLYITLQEVDIREFI